MGLRRRARELALSVLFETEFNGQKPAQVAERLGAEESLHDEILDFLKTLVTNFSENRLVIDAGIEKFSSNWKLSRMAHVDRNILRLGATEILYFPAIPKNVTINEYLEIAKKFGTEDSSSFVNGILDKIEKGESA